MQKGKNIRNLSFDVVKGVAIIAVVLFHFGLCKNGYFGVDIFLLIAGYFTAKSLSRKHQTSIIGGGKYLIDRIIRMLPLLLLAESFILMFGWWMMLPDDFENTAQSVIASNFFANNILQCITTRNYWDISNDFKPLMHTWYLGILMQYYVFIVIANIIINKIRGTHNDRKHFYFMLLIGMISLIAYLFCENAASKFYYLPFRLFEFSAGAIAFYCPLQLSNPSRKKIWTILVVCSYILLIALLFLNISIPKEYLLLTTVVATFILLLAMPSLEISGNMVLSNRVLATVGAASLSIFIWHQIVFALTRYSFGSDFSSGVLVTIMALLVMLLSYLSYRYIERLKFGKKLYLIVSLYFIGINAAAFVIYRNCGVFNDIPELEITKDNTHPGLWAEYCDSGFQFDKDFSDSDKPHWLVIGNSFGRDFVNIISESNVFDMVDLSYTTNIDNSVRIKKADVVFLSTLGVNEKLISDLQKSLNDSTKLYIVGEKNFGENNGQVYKNRGKSDYLKQTVNLGKGYAEKNQRLKNIYGNSYIDLIKLSTAQDGKIVVFSDDGKFISQDCLHLTRAGATFFAEKIDWDTILKN